ncbi:MAG: hypothetical protein NPINA01_06860 [Nitrospinaceae bacterium]|nr:MAG: hypothetical protein NPINA01_06860 [Nitrospinaceae bacterium]
MASYTYELQDPNLLLSNIRQGLVALGGEWNEIALFMKEGHVEYRPKKVNPMRSGYRYVYQRAQLDLTLYFPEKIFERLLEWLDREKLEVMKAVVQSSLSKRSGYDINEFHIRGIIDESRDA